MNSTTLPPTFDWPPDVLAFADSLGLRSALTPMRDATLAIFPALTGLRVFVEKDPELSDWRYLVFEATIPRMESAERQATRAAWVAELRRLCPTPVGREIVASIVQEPA